MIFSGLVSIVVPCRNEELFIGKVIENIINQDYSKGRLEVFIVDGGSSDKTAEIIKEYASKYPFIFYLANPFKTVPYALNSAIKSSKGEVVVRMDAHAEYPLNYVSSLVESLFELNADNVGGAWNTLPGSQSIIAESIALCMSSSFGVGNAYYRTGITKPKQVDTVPFGCYRRQVFEDIGFFDEELTRNQDDEFNGRLIQNGGKIFLIPKIEIRYFARSTWNKMIKMFYQYGFFKPLVNKKLKMPATLRQFVPLGFVLFILISLMSAFVCKICFLLGSLILVFYSIVSLFFSALISRAKKRFKLMFFLPLTFLLIHLSYGWGYLRGIIHFTIIKKRVNKIELSR